MFGQLIPVGGGDPIPLMKEQLLIGRRSSCDITLPFPNVSAHHCQLEILNGYWHVRDLNSSNGTKVNGERVLERFLQPGDTLAVAKHRFEIEYAPDPSLPQPEERDPFAISLLEKAGLMHQQERNRAPRPGTKPAPRPVKPKSDTDLDDPTDEDQALKWLTDG